MFKDVRNRWDQLDRLNAFKSDLRGMDETPLFKSFGEMWEAEKSGIGLDTASYLTWTDEAIRLVAEDPNILDMYQIHIETGYDPAKKLGPFNPIQNILYFRANPWIVAEKVFGQKNLNKACSMASKFEEFTDFQKRFLRDALDPRVRNMLFTACRSGAKTWLTALSADIMVYLMPRIKIMIVSGSQEQSDNLYRYFRDIAIGTPFERLIRDQMYKTRTETIANGWVVSFPASEKKVHGPRPDVVIGDEVCKMDSVILLGAYSAALSARIPKFITISTPDKMIHTFHTWQIEAKRQSVMTPAELALLPLSARWNYYHLSAYDCKWITDEMIQDLTIKYGGKNTHMYKINILGEFAPAEGLVFNAEWIEESIIDDLPTTISIDVEMENGDISTVIDDISLGFYTTGLDAGGKHPSAVVTACEDQNSDVYCIEDDEVMARSGDEPIIASVYYHAKTYNSRTYADAAPIQYFLNRKIKKKLAEDGLQSLSVVPFNKEKGPMISAARGLFEAGMVKILRSKCEKLINQLLTYAYDENENSEMPAKGDDDHVDAFLCAIYPHRNAYLNKRYKRAKVQVYNMEEHLEPVNHNPFSSPVQYELEIPNRRL